MAPPWAFTFPQILYFKKHLITRANAHAIMSVGKKQDTHHLCTIILILFFQNIFKQREKTRSVPPSTDCCLVLEQEMIFIFYFVLGVFS